MPETPAVSDAVGVPFFTGLFNLDVRNGLKIVEHGQRIQIVRISSKICIEDNFDLF